MAQVESEISFSIAGECDVLLDRAVEWATAEGFSLVTRDSGRCILKRGSHLEAGLDLRVMRDVMLLPTTLTIAVAPPRRSGPPPLPGNSPAPPTLDPDEWFVTCHWNGSSPVAFSIKRDLNAVEEKLAHLAAHLGHATIAVREDRCDECGASLKKDAEFCPKCGARRDLRIREALEVERHLLREELSRMAGIFSALSDRLSSGQAGLSMRAATRIMPHDVYEKDTDLPATSEAVLRVAKSLLSREGRIVEEVVTALGDCPGIAGVVKGGTMKLYPVVLSLRILDTEESSCRVRIRGVANEDIVPQQAGQKGVKRLEQGLLSAFG